MAESARTPPAPPPGPGLETLEDALAIAQHHDAITGTSKQHVANDYSKRLAQGWDSAEAAVSQALASLLNTSADGSVFAHCPLLNASLCERTEGVAEGGSVSVLLWNNLGWRRVEPVRLPVGAARDVAVLASDGFYVPSQARANPR